MLGLGLFALCVTFTTRGNQTFIVSTKYGRQSTEGGARGGRLSVGCA